MNLVIRNARLIDGTGADPLAHASVEVTGGMISWIGEESTRPKRQVHQEEVNGQVHQEEVNGQGLTLIPGMIDCHEHFTGDGGMDAMERLLNDTREEFTLKAVID